MDGNGADDVSFFVVNENAARHGDQPTLAHGSKSAEEVRNLLRPLAELSARQSHAQCAPRFAARNIDAQNPRAILTFQSDIVASRIEHDYRQWRAAKFGCLGKGTVDHPKG